MNKQEILQKAEEFAKGFFQGEATGHDWWHTFRVCKLALRIAEQEGAVDLFIIEMAALLHDVSDYKLHNNDEERGKLFLTAWLDKIKISNDDREKIVYIIENMSFDKSLEGKKIKKSKEFMIVEDADRLDALGAIGIARTFAVGGNKGRQIYDSNIKPRDELSREEYINKKKATTINHFYEKLLLLKDLMNTETAKRMALERHQFMEVYLERFFKEWNGEK